MNQKLENIITMTQEQTILKRLDMYLGSSELQPVQVNKNYFIQPTSVEQKSFQKSTQQIFNEIIQNAFDNYIRSGKPDDYVIDVQLSTRKFCVRNNGGVFDIQNEQDVQRLCDVFYKPNTSSHYVTSDQENTAGMNGLGAKLCNYISNYFSVINCSNGNVVKIVFTPKRNLVEKDITVTKGVVQNAGNQKSKISQSYFEVQYELPHDQQIQIIKTATNEVVKDIHFENFNLFMIRQYIQELRHLCPCIKFNGKYVEQIPFEQMYQLKSFVYTTCSSKKAKSKKQKEQKDQKDSKNQKDSKDQKSNKDYNLTFLFNDSVSLCVVNGITSKTGSFLTSIKRSVLSQLSSQLEREVKIPNLNVIVYGECQGIKYNDQIKNVADLNITFTFDQDVLQYASSLLPKTIVKRPMNNIAKLIEATMSGSHNRSLILTEGDSAKTVFERLNTIFHKYNPKPLFHSNGLYPLKGKILNIRRSKTSSDEIDTVMQISGLQKGSHYTLEDIPKLRYQRIIIATDFDEDGYHIKNLIINFLLTYWPELIDLGYVQEFISPILRYTTQNGEKKYCYNIHELQNEQQTQNQNQNQPNQQQTQPKIKSIKYYKGLGTLENEDLQMICKNFNHHIKTIDASVPTKHPLMKEQYSNVHDLIEMYLTNLFSADTTKRKSLIMGYKYNPINYNLPNVSVIQEFNQFLEYGYTTQNRAIPSEIDGLKDSQRKIIYYVLKYLSNSQEMKVAQLSGYVSAKLDYHHGETSLDGAIVQLAQSFAGSNNIPLLVGKGSFGTRSNPDAIAASRYIYVQKSPILKYIFREEDEIIYQYNKSEDNSSQIEPFNLYPVIPIHLINGVKGIGTGFSSTIPSFNPQDVIEIIVNVLQAQLQSGGSQQNDTQIKVTKTKSLKTNLIPYYNNYVGTIQPTKDASGKVVPYQFTCEASIQEVPQQYVLINDVCILTNIQKLIEVLKEKNILGDIQYLGDTTIKFSLTQQKNQQIWEEIKSKYMSCIVSTKNMVVLKDNQVPATYSSPLKLLLDWIKVRYQFYIKRKIVQLQLLIKDFLEQYYIDQFVQKKLYKKLQDDDFNMCLQNFPTKQQMESYQIPYQKYMSRNDLSFEEIIQDFVEYVQNEHADKNKCLNENQIDENQIDQCYGYLTHKTIRFYNKWQGYESLVKQIQTLFSTHPSRIFLNEVEELKEKLNLRN